MFQNIVLATWGSQGAWDVGPLAWHKLAPGRGSLALIGFKAATHSSTVCAKRCPGHHECAVNPLADSQQPSSRVG